MQEKLTITQRFWRLIKADGREIRNVYYYSFFAGLISLSLPLGIQAIINLIQGGRVNSAWIVMVVIVVLGVALNGILQILQLRITENIQQRIFTRAAFEFAYRIPRIKLENLFLTYTPELINRFFDTMTIQKGLSKLLITISTAGIQVFLGLILLSLYHPFFIFFTVLLFIIFYLIFQFTGKKGFTTSLEESKHKYNLAHWLEEVGRTSISFKLAGKTDYALERSNYHAEEYLKSRENHFKVLVKQFSLLVVFKVIVVTGLLAIGGVLVMEQEMNIGQFVAAEIIIVMIINSIEKLIRNLETVYDVLTGIEKVAQVTDLSIESEEGIDLREDLNSNGLEIHLNDVSFQYPNSNFYTLKDISLHIQPNQNTVITGANSSGKSTMLQVIAGLYDTQKGSTAYNNLSIGSLNIESLRSVIGANLNQEDLFFGTLLENIVMGRKDATQQNVKWAIENVGLTKFISELRDGYNTLILPNGKSLPKSVIQKLLIARCIVDQPKLILLEYSFEHINYSDKMKIMRFLFSRENNWTLVAVSKDLDLIKQCDKVIIMENGKIDQQGDYEQLKDSLQKL